MLAISKEKYSALSNLTFIDLFAGIGGFRLALDSFGAKCVFTSEWDEHSQKVYKGVYEFTNLVKKDVVLNKAECNIKNILYDYLSSTAYISQVILDDNLPTIELNEPLFCTAVDNLIRNGLKYNDSETKFVKIYGDEDSIYIQDNGRGITQDDFNHLSKPYTRKEGQKESGTGLGLNICVAILEEHKFKITCEKNEIGTKMKIKIK